MTANYGLELSKYEAGERTVAAGAPNCVSSPSKLLEHHEAALNADHAATEEERL